MTALSNIAEIARAARIGDLSAVNSALDRMNGQAALDVIHGRAVADRGSQKDPPLPPVDHTALMNAEGWGDLSRPTFPERAPKKKRGRK